MTPDVQPPIITRYGYSWLQHPDGLYYGPSYPGEDTTLAWMEEQGTLGHRSVARGDYRYVLRHPEQAAPAATASAGRRAISTSFIQMGPRSPCKV